MLNAVGIEGIYIVHAVSGYELHEQRIDKLFKQLHLQYEFVTDGDPTNLTDAMINKYFCSHIKESLRLGVLSCTLNHILCYERIVAKRNRYALVFENDPFFIGDFIKKIKLVANEAGMLEDGFIVSLENTTLKFPSVAKTRKGKYLYKSSYGRCAGAYMIDLAGAHKILEHLKTNKCCDVIDWWHNKLVKDNVVAMYWAHPPLTEQGSHNGLMHSTISSKNHNLIRRVQWISQKCYRTYIRRNFKNDAY